MEIEMKYLMEDSFAKERIFSDSHLLSMADEKGLEIIPMKAVYLDTEEKNLLKQKIAFRIRYEDDRLVATVKWGGGAENGLHTRGELNAAVDEAFLENPTLEIFRGSQVFEKFGTSLEGKKLVPVMEMEFLRKQLHIDTGKSMSVLSYDEGSIHTCSGDAPISEIEIELYSGDQEDMITLGKELALKYNLKPADVSKYQRGLDLMGIRE